MNGTEGTLRVLNANDLTTVTDISTPEGNGKLSVSPDHKLWIPAGVSSKIAIVDMASNTLETTLNTPDFNSFYGPYTIAFSNSALTGINQSEPETGLSIYPNPSNGTFNISHQSALQSVEIFSTTGKMIQKYNPDQMEQPFTFKGTNGSYMIRIKDRDGKVQNKILLIHNQ
ncbi:MAG: T9SS type A sorting domain-containing protein [Bacteroidales bacterium]